MIDIPEDVLCSVLCRVGGLCSARTQHVVDGLDDLGHLVLIDHTVTVNVVHPEKQK